MVKQVIVIRKDLKMGKGKMIVQACHASLNVFLKKMINDQNGNESSLLEKHGKYQLKLDVEENSEFDQWLKGLYKKVCLYVNSEEELIDIYMKAKNKHLPSILIEDVGKTTFNGIKTRTCVAIGPAESNLIDEITGELRLL